MMKTLSTAIAIAAMALVPAAASAQQDVEADLQVDIVSNHLWRGQDYGGASIQPTATLSWRGLYATIFGSKGFDAADVERVDVGVGYKAPFGLNVGVQSHWNSGVAFQDRYFVFNEDETAHKIEGNIGYTCRYFSAQAYCIFYGYDHKLNGDQAYSTYVELTVPFRLGGLDWRAQVGVTPMESAGWKTPVTDRKFVESVNDYLYGDGFTVCHASLRATKAFKAGRYDLPVFVEFDANPYSEKAAIVAGVTLRPFKK